MRVCYRCNINKPLTEFHNSRTEKLGKGYRCKDCIKKHRPSRKTTRPFANQSLSERFFSKINPIPTEKGCWEWTESLAGYWYGQMHFHGKWYRAHRLSYEIHKGSIPDGMSVCHSCDNSKCCNPSHLWIGTHQENCIDRGNKKRGNNRKGERHHGSKLNKEKIIEIRLKYGKEISQSELAKEYNISQRNIWYIVNNKAWKHIT